ncbi:HAD-IC family P-type ATPase [Methylosinus sp. Sm6]|nr:HAD-IC family P-type ATPase [Methylosinus sp. Sm6]
MQGLTSAEARARLLRFGPNTLPEPRPPSILSVFLRQFLSPLIYILVAAALVALLIGDAKDALFIAIVLLINGVIGAVQEYSASRAAAALREQDQPHALVIRDGVRMDIDARELVPGDCALLEAGRRAPADIRLVEADDLRCDESLLTGESLPVRKAPQTAPFGREAERSGMAFAGSMVTRGRGAGVVEATGRATQVGRIAESLAEPSISQPPLMIRMERFSRMVAIIIGAAIAVLAAIGFARQMPLVQIFMMAVGLAVAAIPEGLPVAISVALAIGMRRMAKANVIVRRMPAVEALGSCTMIASDKTGTLTLNQLTVTTIALPDGTVLTCEPDGETLARESGAADAAGERADLLVAALLRAAALPNEAEIWQEREGMRTVGDTVDVALLVAAHRGGVPHDALRERYPLIKRIPYEPDIRYAASFHRHEQVGTVRVFAKGAPEALIPMASRMDVGGEAVPIDRDAIIAQKDAMSAQGLRVLAFVEGEVAAEPDGEYGPGHLDNLVFLGLAGMQDPLRPEARRAIRACYGAGVEVAMVTGDSAGTAAAVAEQAGMEFTPEQVVTGADVRRAEELGEATLDELTRRARVYARVEPIQKLAIVLSLARNGHFVAVTGDGVNDAPALKHAHVGVAMGKHGTDVAKESADIIVADDNFASIVRGVREGRVAYSNIRKVIFLLVSTGAAELLLFLLAIPLGMPMPLLPVQLLWLNLVTNGVQHVALAAEKPEGDELRYPPRRPEEPIFDRVMVERNVYSAIVMACVGFGVFDWLLDHGYDEAHARNLLLLLFVIFENFQALNALSERHSVFYRSLLASPFLLASVVGAQAIHLAAMRWPPLAELLRIAPVTFREWGYLMLAGSSLLVVIEIAKWLGRRRGPRAAAPIRAPAWGVSQRAEAKDWRWAGLVGSLAVAAIAGSLYLATRREPILGREPPGAPAERAVEAHGVVSLTPAEAVRAKIAGVLGSVDCPVGASVAAGQICARIDSRALDTALAQAREARDAAARRAESSDVAEKAAKAALERAEAGKAARRTARARAALSRAQNRQARDAAQLERRKTELAKAQADLAGAEIVAPIAGTVAERNAARGRTVAPSDAKPLFLIEPQRPLRVAATLDAASAPRAQLGDPALVSIGGQELAGTVVEAEALPDGGRRIVVAAEKPEPPPPPGAEATVKIRPAP